MTATTSLCPVCLRRVPAQRVAIGNDIYLRKTCPEHGALADVLLWRGDRVSYEAWTRPRSGSCRASACHCDTTAATTATQETTESDCPRACGLCPQHRQRTCSALIEVTARCNLNCPVCFAATAASPAGSGATADPDQDRLERMLIAVRNSSGNCPVQFSGGEPTLRDDLPEIIRRARALGFDHIQINTNGLRLATDPDYAAALRDAGVTDFFLQFDGCDDASYRRLRGRNLWALKEKAVSVAARLKVAVILVPTLTKGVNDTAPGDILRFAKKWIPTVKGVHFQPQTHLGRYPHEPRNEDRLTIPDVLEAIERQSNGELKIENFIPSACEDPCCSFSALAVLEEDGRLVPATHIDLAGARGCDAAEKSIAYVRRHWKYATAPNPPVNTGTAPVPDNAGKRPPSADTSTDATGATGNAPVDTLIERIRNYSLCISGMAFQDVWNLDLDRLRRCCIHVATPDLRLVPFCAHYLTGIRGQRLYTQQG